MKYIHLDLRLSRRKCCRNCQFSNDKVSVNKEFFYCIRHETEYFKGNIFWNMGPCCCNGYKERKNEI